MSTGPLEHRHRHVERVELPDVTAEGTVDAAVRVATQIAAGLVENEPAAVAVDRAEITGLRPPKVDLHPDGRVTSEQEVTVELKLRVKSAARLALGASSSFVVEESEARLTPRVKGEAT